MLLIPKYLSQLRKQWLPEATRFMNHFRGADGCRLEYDAHGPVLRLGDDTFAFRELTTVRPVFDETGALTSLKFQTVRALCTIPEELANDVAFEPCTEAEDI